MKLLEGRNPQYFEKRWQRFSLVVFIVSWATMLFPLLLFPDAIFAGIVTFGLLGLGAISVLSLLGDVILRLRS